MRECALFAGAGGSLLAGKLLGWTPIVAVEWDAHCQRIIKARQRDGMLPSFPIYDDVRTWPASDWRGRVDVVTAGFPCQPFSRAGKQRGADDERNMWPATAQSIRELGPDGSCWRTPQSFLPLDISASSCVTFPRSGSWASGRCYERQKPAPLTAVPARGSSLPTPTVSSARGSGYQQKNGRIYPTLSGVVGAAYVPTPSASSYGSNRGGAAGRVGKVRYSPESLARMKGSVGVVPTPTASDWKGSTKKGQRRGQLSERTEPGSGGRLNPQWVEWVMGWPLGWTSLGPMPPEEMDAWRRLHDCTPTQRPLWPSEGPTTDSD